MSDKENLKSSIMVLAVELGLSEENRRWVRVLNDIAVHFAVWNGWSLDRLTGMQLDEILALLQQEQAKDDTYEVGRSFRHSEDFSFVSWNGDKYHLNRSQAKVFELLYQESMRGTAGLHQSTIGQRLNSTNTQFRLLHIFRLANGEMHPIWGKLIVSLEPGVYGVQMTQE